MHKRGQLPHQIGIHSRKRTKLCHNIRFNTFNYSECETQYVTFTKEMCGSTGIELAGGNMTGIFICHVVCGGNAQATGAREGDQILKVSCLHIITLQCPKSDKVAYFQEKYVFLYFSLFHMCFL